MTDLDADHSLKPGVYRIFRCTDANDIAMDLSGSDQKSIISFPAHGGPNQSWEFSRLGKGYSIRSLLTGDYLTVEQGIYDGAPIVASPYPVSWALEAERGLRDVWRIIWPNTQFVFGPKDGNDKPGTLIQLCRRTPLEPCELWRFVLQQPASAPRSASVPEVPLEEVSEPRGLISSTTENTTNDHSMKLGGHSDFTITTTTTTVTTTVTKIAKPQEF